MHRVHLHPDWVMVRDDARRNSIIHDGYGYKQIVHTSDHTIDIKNLRGITVALRKRFWENYVPPTPKTRTVQKVKRAKSRNAARIMGLVRGQTIHKELKTYIQALQYGSRGLHADQEMCIATFKALHPNYHAAVPTIINIMKSKWNWIPVGAEMNVTDGPWATGIDFLAIDLNDNSLILGELKTGYNDIFQLGTHPMSHGLAISNSPLNQAKVQLIASSILFSKMYPLITSYQMIIVHITSDGTKVKQFRVSANDYAVIHEALDKYWFHSK